MGQTMIQATCGVSCGDFEMLSRISVLSQFPPTAKSLHLTSKTKVDSRQLFNSLNYECS